MNDLKIYPFGGVGEIGSNMTIFETKSHLIVVDYGILFPFDDFFNINYLIADTSQLKDKVELSNKKVTLFITHGHEDHIGATAHLIQDFPEMEIFAPEFPSILIRTKLEYRKINKKINIYTQSDSFIFDQYTLHPIHVTHSIPQTHGLVLHSKEFSTLFISDFKFDLTPSFENEFDVEKIKKLFATTETSLAMLDSTNILSPGKTLSESDLIFDLEKIISKDQRIFFTMFSSNIFRVQNILTLAKKHNKKIVTIGRSISKYLDAAEEAKLLKRSNFPLVDLEAVQDFSSSDIVYLVTGSQGEYLGAAKRIITGEQKHIKLTPKDIFVFSSKPIPGNEKKIQRLYNQLSDQDVEIITFKDMKIHASGHPCQEDLRQLLFEIKPQHVIPIHGESYFLHKHITFLNENFPAINTHLLKNFKGIEIVDNNILPLSFKEIPPHIIHGKGICIEREKISERRKLADHGSVFISINYKSRNTAIKTLGLPIQIDIHIPKLKELIIFCIFSENKNRDHDYSVEQARIKTRTFFNSILGYKPITIVQMV